MTESPPGLSTETDSAAGKKLAYTRPLSQKARYHLSLAVQGEQVSLEERLPINWQAEIELREEVIALEQDGTMWIRVQGKILKTRALNGVFASGLPRNWPTVDYHLTQRGEVLAVYPFDSGASPDTRERAFLALAAQPPLIILPDRPVQAGEEWRWESGEARQTNRCLAFAGADETLTVTLESVTDAPLTLEEASLPLGIRNKLTGKAVSHVRAALLLGQGLYKWQKGELHLWTKSETTLDTLQGKERFAMEADLSVSFDFRLLDVSNSSSFFPPANNQR